ncbi:MAG: hypothetical protein M1839_007953 [Geoglossum umbratile]|nr:MAG: hypothetical protein M1839_007953 [Geoglossum umbratile]
MPQFIDLIGDSPPPGQLQQPGQSNTAARCPANETGSNPALGGGTEVRICNPCVPDPNNEPPPQQGRQQNPGNARHLPTLASPGFNPMVDDDVFRSSSLDHPNRHTPRHSWTGSRPDQNSPRPAFHYYGPSHHTTGLRPPNDPTLLPPFQNLRFDDDTAGAVRGRNATRARNPGNFRAAGSQGGSYPIARNSGNPADSRSSRSVDLGAPLRFPRFIPTNSTDEGEATASYVPPGITYAGHGRYEQAAFNTSVVPPPNIPAVYDPQASSSSAPTRGSYHGPPRNPGPGPAPGNAYPQRHYRSMLDVDNATPAPPAPPPPHHPRPDLREEDYCPICQAILPPPRPDGDEGAREAHIENCIQISFYGSHRSTPTTTSSQQQQPTPSSAPDTQAPASTPSPAGGSPIRPRRGTVGRMVAFLATEKDCAGEGGEGVAECIICFEDIEVGAEMARLECLCKFHKACVRKWWDTKGQGACPVHQDNGF